MANVFFKQYPVTDLIAVVEQQIAQHAAANETAIINAKRNALEIYSAYEHKDSNGRPIPPPPLITEQNKWVDVELTPGEAAALDISQRRISVQELLGIVGAEVTASSADVGKRSMAAYLLATGERKYDRYNRKVTEADARHAAALKAYQALSKPAAQDDGAGRARRIQGFLKRTSQVDGGGKLYLADDEHLALRSGDFEKIGAQCLSEDAQRIRPRVNACVRRLQDQDAVQSGIPFEPFYDPQRMSDIEALMLRDTTAGWLYQDAQKRGLPIILCRYKLPDSMLANQPARTLATYCRDSNTLETHGRGTPSSTITSSINYIKLFVNLCSNLDMAVSLAHEARHHWQEKSMISRAESAAMNPVERIVWELLQEADAHAIHTKVEWGLHRNTPKKGLQPGHHHAFEGNFTKLSPEDAPLGVKIQRATQARFMSFLEGEFSKPFYLKQYIADADPFLEIWCRSLPDTPILGAAFLDRLSTVGSVAYLDRAGMHDVRKIFTEKLPSIIAQLKPGQDLGSIFGNRWSP